MLLPKKGKYKNIQLTPSRKYQQVESCYLYVNDNKDYTVSVNLYMDYNTGKIKDGGGSLSPELNEFVKGKKDE